MKYLAVLFLGLLAEGSFIHKCAPKGVLDPIGVYDLFEQGTAKVPTPIIESGDDLASEFSDNLGKVLKIWYMSLLDNLVCQTIHAGRQLADCIKNTTRALKESLTSDAEYVDDELQNLTNQLKTVLALKPGNVEIKRSVLPPLPALAQYESRPTKRTLTELFLEFDSVFDNVPQNGYAYTSTLLIQGWRDFRFGYRNFSTQLRNGVLNDKVLAAAKVAVDKVYHQVDLVQSKVSKDTWRSFKDAGRLIVTISKEYNATKKGEYFCSTCTQCAYTV